MKLENGLKKYYNAKVTGVRTPRVPGLDFIHEASHRNRDAQRRDIILNVFVHVMIVLALAFLFTFDKKETELSIAMDRYFEEFHQGKYLYNGLIYLSKHVKPVSK